MRAGPLGAAALALLATRAAAGSREVELGAESLSYRTASTSLNRDNVLGLDDTVEILRGTLHLKQILGEARFVFRGFVERDFGAPGDKTRWTVRQAYAQYGWGSGLSLRLGKQRIAWGSGFAWNPTNRVEPPKNPLNTGLEQEGALAARMDWVPASWAGVILVAARGETAPGDLPLAIPVQRRRTAALRARFLVKDTDLALVFSGGKNQRTLLGFDVGRAIRGQVATHAEGAFYRGAELGPPRDAETFFRLAAGLLYNRGETSLSLEYFRNGEGYPPSARDAYLAGLDASYARATDPRLPAPARAQAMDAYLAGAGLPFAGGLGLRRHYVQASWTRGTGGGKWTASLRGAVGVEDGGTALTPGVVYAPRGDLTLHLDAVVLLGPEASEYRLAPFRGAVQARIKVIFQ